jgi:hypothetical protein
MIRAHAAAARNTKTATGSDAYEPVQVVAQVLSRS